LIKILCQAQLWSGRPSIQELVRQREASQLLTYALSAQALSEPSSFTSVAARLPAFTASQQQVVPKPQQNQLQSTLQSHVQPQHLPASLPSVTALPQPPMSQIQPQLPVYQLPVVSAVQQRNIQIWPPLPVTSGFGALRPNNLSGFTQQQCGFRPQMYQPHQLQIHQSLDHHHQGYQPRFRGQAPPNFFQPRGGNTSIFTPVCNPKRGHRDGATEAFNSVKKMKAGKPGKPTTDTNGYPLPGKFKNAWFKAFPNMFSSAETMAQQSAMMVPINYPERHSFQIAFYCNGSMDQQQLFLPQLFTNNIPVYISIPVTCWGIPLPDNYGAIQLNGHKPFFQSNDWATDLIGLLMQLPDFDPSHQLIIMIYADPENLMHRASAGTDLSTIADTLLATFDYLADVFKCHIVFTGMTVIIAQTWPTT
jgi:hypothetical protein